MDTTVSVSPNEVAPVPPRRRREWLYELRFLGIAYVVTVFAASLSISLCGPGCCYIFYSIIAGVSGILMLRRPFLSRCVCLGVLLLSLVGMWHEKEVRDTWGQRVLRLQIQNLQQELQKVQNKRHSTSDGFRDLATNSTLQQIIDRVGMYDRVRGSGISYYEYDFPDGSAVLVCPDMSLAAKTNPRVTITFYRSTNDITLSP